MSLFGSNTNTGPGGAAQNNTAQGGGVFGGGLFGAKPAGGAATGGGLFGSSAAGNSNTGTSAPNPLFGAPSGGNTNNISSAPTSGFGGGSAFGGGGLFGAKPAGSNTAAGTGAAGGTASTTGSTGTPGLFGGGLFGSKPADQGTSAPKPPTSNLFGAPAASAPGASGASAAPGSGSTPLFGASKPAENATTSSTPTNTLGGGLFGKKPEAPTGSSAPAASSFGAFSLGGGAAANKDKPEEKKDAAPAVPSLFSLGGAGTSSAATADKGDKKDGATAQTAPSAFSSFSLPKPGEASATTTSTERKDAAPASGFSLGAGLANKSTTPTAGTQSSTSAPAAPANTSTALSVPPPSMLRGKSIEEIVNRWSTDLETHVREFTKFSSEVAVWDRALIENGNNLAALYSHVLAAEREQNDIDQSLDHVEQQQRELLATLEVYEKQMDEVMGGQGGNLRALDTGPADTERDKNYMLATELHSHLDDLSSSLTQLIESVNTVSLGPSTETPADDPMAQIAQVLSSHLESLQWIDGASRELEGKVAEVEKRVKDAGLSTNAYSTNSGSGGRSRGFGLAR